MLVDGRNRHKIDVINRELVVAVHKVNTAFANAVNGRDVQLHHLDPRRHGPGASLQRTAVRRGRIAHTQGHGGYHGFVILRRCAARRRPMGVDDDIDSALSVQQHFSRAVPRHGPKAHHLQHLPQCLGFAGGVFNELNAFQPERVDRV